MMGPQPTMVDAACAPWLMRSAVLKKLRCVCVCMIELPLTAGALFCSCMRLHLMQRQGSSLFIAQRYMTSRYQYMKCE